MDKICDTCGIGHHLPSGVCDHCNTSNEVIELALCEAAKLMLRPNQLYRFTVRPGCAACAKAAEPYREDEETPAERYDREVYGDKWHTPMSL